MPEQTIPTGIAWQRRGDEIVGVVLVQHPDGTRERIATVTYTLEQAAQVAGQLLGSLGGAR